MLYCGTLVHWSVKVDEPDLIEKALVFTGKQHEIAFDYIDKKFAIADEFSSIVVSQYRQDTTTRSGGMRFRTLLENIISATASKQVEISFLGMNIVSSSFADEAFAKLVSHKGLGWYQSHISIVDAHSTIRKIIAREIDSRMNRLRS